MVDTIRVFFFQI